MGRDAQETRQETQWRQQTRQYQYTRLRHHHHPQPPTPRLPRSQTATRTVCNIYIPHESQLFSMRLHCTYELVRVKRRKFSPPRMPLELSTRMSHTRHEQSKRVFAECITSKNVQIPQRILMKNHAKTKRHEQSKRVFAECITSKNVQIPQRILMTKNHAKTKNKKQKAVTSGLPKGP